MQIEPSGTFLACRERLTGDRPHRVWSLIITIFGDLAQGPGEQIDGAALTQILGLVGIRPEAMRVALHRLRKDDWIESRRIGRTSVHCLTEFGRQQCLAASPRIYGPGMAADTQLHLLIADEKAGETRRGCDGTGVRESHVTLGSNLLLGAGPPPDDTSGLWVVIVRDVEVTDWVQDRVCPPKLAEEYERLFVRFEALRGDLERAKSLSAPEAIAIRALVVHSWRRVILRHADLPPQFFPADWMGIACRDSFRQILARLPVTGMAWLFGADGQTGSVRTRANALSRP